MVIYQAPASGSSESLLRLPNIHVPNLAKQPYKGNAERICAIHNMLNALDRETCLELLRVAAKTRTLNMT